VRRGGQRLRDSQAKAPQGVVRIQFDRNLVLPIRMSTHFGTIGARK